MDLFVWTVLPAFPRPYSPKFKTHSMCICLPLHTLGDIFTFWKVCHACSLTLLAPFMPCTLFACLPRDYKTCLPCALTHPSPPPPSPTPIYYIPHWRNPHHTPTHPHSQGHFRTGRTGQGQVGGRLGGTVGSTCASPHPTPTALPSQTGCCWAGRRVMPFTTMAFICLLPSPYHAPPSPMPPSLPTTPCLPCLPNNSACPQPEQCV